MHSDKGPGGLNFSKDVSQQHQKFFAAATTTEQVSTKSFHKNQEGVDIPKEPHKLN